MPYEHTSTRRIEFSETDMAGLVHFSNFFRYMETAERDFFEAAGVELINTQPGKLVGWPRVRAPARKLPKHTSPPSLQSSPKPANSSPSTSPSTYGTA